MWMSRVASTAWLSVVYGCVDQGWSSAVMMHFANIEHHNLMNVYHHVHSSYLLCTNDPAFHIPKYNISMLCRDT
ncbi:hypothetical protein CEXT_316661 [Caerostris extrusa]|uniref:Secreted protein n=1 Tax=Caerostris extrusa TaxID=172846 RepID=A0AAV4RJ13_CAEEX|nr:hypothetical protein CEXT_316661 [Caerostris extrusa]